ncbi:hypothetical protein [Stakelama pacifica]|nr:hypothetical protein [Stakelama pacifica]
MTAAERGSGGGDPGGVARAVADAADADGALAILERALGDPA